MLANADNQSAFVADEKRRLLHPPLEGEGRRDRLRRSSRGGVKLAAPAPPEGFTPPRAPPRAKALSVFATLPFQGRVKQGTVFLIQSIPKQTLWPSLAASPPSRQQRSTAAELVAE